MDRTRPAARSAHGALNKDSRGPIASLMTWHQHTTTDALHTAAAAAAAVVLSESYLSRHRGSVALVQQNANSLAL